MSDGNRKILYEARLAQLGRRYFWTCAVLAVPFTGGGVAMFLRPVDPCTDTPADHYVPVGILALIAAFLIYGMIFSGWLWRNPGVYRISIDDQGLYVHSDAPKFMPSFTVAATDIHRLVQKTVSQSDGPDTLEYYVETKTGVRHVVGKFAGDLDFDGMKLFGKITDRFYWVGVHKDGN